MTNEVQQSLKKIGKILLVLFLLFVSALVLDTFVHFSQMDKQISAGNVDYSKIASGETQNTSVQKTDGSKSSNDTLIYGDGTNYYLGVKNPKVNIVEFADFSCPYCQKSFSTIREISVKYSKDIKFTFRDLPIVSENSVSLALAARCAGEQGLFWMMHDRLYMNQGKTSKDDLIRLAKQTGADTKKFEQCYDSQKYLNAVKKDYSDAVELGIDQIGTPVWYINGQQVSGQIPEETFTKIIESILNK